MTTVSIGDEALGWGPLRGRYLQPINHKHTTRPLHISPLQQERYDQSETIHASHQLTSSCNGREQSKFSNPSSGTGLDTLTQNSMSVSRKRKNRAWTGSESRLNSNADGSLYFEAHEADVEHGSQAAAASLEVTCIGKPGSALVCLGDGYDSAKAPEVWVDRYDVRLLLDLSKDVQVELRSDSPAGWSDVPSDAEDTFFLSPEEVDDYQRDKKRRLNNRVQEERLRARIEEDGDEPDDIWGGSDEEPDEAVMHVMQKTAKLISSAPNPTQMEMKILVEFGEKQPAFAFLKGRWKRRWAIIKAVTNQEKKNASGLGGLADYGDSDEDP